MDYVRVSVDKKSETKAAALQNEITAIENKEDAVANRYIALLIVFLIPSFVIMLLDFLGKANTPQWSIAFYVSLASTLIVPQMYLLYMCKLCIPKKIKLFEAAFGVTYTSELKECLENFVFLCNGNDAKKITMIDGRYYYVIPVMKDADYEDIIIGENSGLAVTLKRDGNGYKYSYETTEVELSV